ncbi:hypothetical protein KIH27_04290 [Mycobacterium sp. M1]|uniref:ESX-1 secretion-associated protein EspA/EspE-like domain-containing protein n=1 Tax=Mycolicibacter acidiphilus TaxID=2835306 RepID=A0ABS5RH69_9MYCO|nr:EspA/EspE family type VII secretion system effector [Mycolicibacter acidiphilus]MBS9532806.1 hypothetical protein [Mycolicibacter acidiphilus]
MGYLPDALTGIEKGLDAAKFPSDVLNLINGPGKGIPSKAFTGLGALNTGLKTASHLDSLMHPKSALDFAKSAFDLQADGAKIGVSTLRSAVTAARALENAGRILGHEGLQLYGEKMVSRLSRAGLANAEALATPILETALLALTGMSLMLGFGDPETGNRFGDGVKIFDTVDKELDSAKADSWKGSASDAYAHRNSEQKDRVTRLGKIDGDIQRIVSAEADEIKTTSTTVDIASDFLTLCIPAAIALNFFGPEASLPFQTAMVILAMPPAALMMERMQVLAMQHTMEILKLVQAYSKVASEAHPTGSPPAISPTPTASIPKDEGTRGKGGTGSSTDGKPGDINLAAKPQNPSATPLSSKASGNAPGNTSGGTAPSNSSTPSQPGAPHSTATPNSWQGSSPASASTSVGSSPTPSPSTAATPSASAAPGTSAGPGTPPVTPTSSSPQSVGGRPTGGDTSTARPVSVNPNGAGPGPGVRDPAGGTTGGSTPGAQAGATKPSSPAPVGPVAKPGSGAPIAHETRSDTEVEVTAT